MSCFAGLHSLSHVEKAARETMGDALYDHVAGGVADELTLRWNVELYGALKLRPRVLRDVSQLEPATMLLGQRRPWPALVAPMANQQLIHPEEASWRWCAVQMQAVRPSC